MRSHAQTIADEKQKELNLSQDNQIKELNTEILKLTMENAEMRDRLVNRGDGDWLKTLVHETPNNMELGKKIRSMQDYWNEEQEGC